MNYSSMVARAIEAKNMSIKKKTSIFKVILLASIFFILFSTIVILVYGGFNG
jgi:hypothetical protein